MSSLCAIIFIRICQARQKSITRKKNPSWFPKLRFPFPACFATPEIYFIFSSFVYLFLSTATPFSDSIHYHIAQWRWPPLVQSCYVHLFLFSSPFSSSNSFTPSQVTCRKRKPRKSRSVPNTTSDLSCAPDRLSFFQYISILLDGKLLFFCQRIISRGDGNTFTSHLPQAT